MAERVNLEELGTPNHKLLGTTVSAKANNTDEDKRRQARTFDVFPRFAKFGNCHICREWRGDPM